MPLTAEQHNNALNEIIAAIHEESVNVVSVVASVASQYGSIGDTKKDDTQDKRDKIKKSILKTKVKINKKKKKENDNNNVEDIKNDNDIEKERIQNDTVSRFKAAIKKSKEDLQLSSLSAK